MKSYNKDDYKYILHIEHKFENLSSIIANLISTVESKKQKEKKKKIEPLIINYVESKLEYMSISVDKIDNNISHLIGFHLSICCYMYQIEIHGYEQGHQ